MHRFHSNGQFDHVRRFAWLFCSHVFLLAAAYCLSMVSSWFDIVSSFGRRNSCLLCLAQGHHLIPGDPYFMTRRYKHEFFVDLDNEHDPTFPYGKCAGPSSEPTNLARGNKDPRIQPVVCLYAWSTRRSPARPSIQQFFPEPAHKWGAQRTLFCILRLRLRRSRFSNARRGSHFRLRS
jgi:hypothetical protein